MTDWLTLTPAEKQTAIRPLWEAGKSASEISREFINATRNSIISALHRGKMTNGMPTRQVRAKASYEGQAPKPKRARKPVPAQPGTPPLLVRIPDPDTPPASVLAMINGDRPPLAGVTPIDIMALPLRQGVRCRFPVTGDGGKMMYCGASSGDHSYCEPHRAIAYKPVEKREARR